MEGGRKWREEGREGGRGGGREGEEGRRMESKLAGWGPGNRSWGAMKHITPVC